MLVHAYIFVTKPTKRTVKIAIRLVWSTMQPFKGVVSTNCGVHCPWCGRTRRQSLMGTEWGHDEEGPGCAHFIEVVTSRTARTIPPPLSIRATHNCSAFGTHLLWAGGGAGGVGVAHMEGSAWPALPIFHRSPKGPLNINCPLYLLLFAGNMGSKHFSLKRIKDSDHVGAIMAGGCHKG